MRRARRLLALVAFGWALPLAGTALANGEEFFAPAKNSHIDLVYFGRIKDKRTGRSVADSVYFLLKDQSTGLSFPFTNDRPGHYRSPDIGTAIKEIGEGVDVNAFEVEVNAAGYKKLIVARVPRKSQGNVELDLALEPLASAPVAAAELGASNALPRIAALGGLLGALLMFLIGRGARTSVRQPTTKR